MPQLLRAAFLIAGASFVLPGFAQAQSAAAPPLVCAAPPDLTRLEFPLARTAGRIAAGESITIVAVGSSSTAGAGASAPAMSYPSRLEAELKLRFPGVPITVLNRGVNGEDAAQMMARFDRDVLAEDPDLVLWQVGTNAVLRDETAAEEAPLLRDGIARLKAANAEVVLMDPQYAPKVLAKPDAERMVDLIGATARDQRIGNFRRFAVMRQWHEADRVPFDATLSPDGLHMNDWGYGCVAKLLGGAIADAVRTGAMARVPEKSR
jgi:lysophospholipase L1-like esterase